MPDAFFQKKRKRTTSSSSSAGGGVSGSRSQSTAGPSRLNKKGPPNGSSKGRMKQKGRGSDEEEEDGDDDAAGADGIDEMDLRHRYDEGLNSEEEAELAETPAEARVRLAKMYLQGLKETDEAARAQSGGQEDDDFFESGGIGFSDAAQADRDNIAARLQKDVAEQSGKIHMFISKRLATPSEVDYEDSMLAVRGHRLSVTSAVASQDARTLFTAGKDGSIIRWRLRDGKMLRTIPKRAKVLDDQGRPVPPNKNNRSKTSGAARRRERLTRVAAGKGKSKASEDPSSNGISNDTRGSVNSLDQPAYLSISAGEGHTDEVWTLSISSDGKYLASGGKDKRICIWSLYSDDQDEVGNSGAEIDTKFVKALGGHKDSVSSLCFRHGSQELYTASMDRTLKLFDISQLSYIETLFGHQEAILSLSCLGAETAISAGGRDRTCRYWKIRDESQLVFRAGHKSKLREVLEGGDLARLQEDRSSSGIGTGKGESNSMMETMEGSVECVSMIDTQHFVSGGDSGTISLWNLGKKKPIFSVPLAHGYDVTSSETEGEIQTPRWITSLAALAYSDVFVSGSWDGSIRVWGLQGGGAGGIRSFAQLFSFDAPGVINSLQMILPPLASVVVSETRVPDQASEATALDDGGNDRKLITTLAIRPKEWKRRHGLSSSAPAAGSEEAELTHPHQVGLDPKPHQYQKLSKIAGTKDNLPPIIIAGIGQEHKFGRWIKLPNARNGALVIPLQLKLRTK